MKKIVALLLVLLLSVGLFSACGDDGGDAYVADDNTDAAEQDADYGMVTTEEGYYQDFEFVNSTEVAIVEIRASAGGSDMWREDMLDGEVVGPGQYCLISIYIIPGDTTDFQVTAENGYVFEMRGYQLENYSTLELTPGDDGEGLLYLSGEGNGGSGNENIPDDDYGMVTTEEGYYQEFQFTNSTGVGIVEMRASAGGSDMWRENMIDGGILMPDHYVIMSIYIIPGDTTDFQIVAENGATFELRGYELEDYSILELTPGDDGEGLLYLS